MATRVPLCYRVLMPCHYPIIALALLLAGWLAGWLVVWMSGSQPGGAQPRTILAAVPTLQRLWVWFWSVCDQIQSTWIPPNSHSRSIRIRITISVTAREVSPSYQSVYQSINHPIILSLSLSNLSIYLSIFYHIYHYTYHQIYSTVYQLMFQSILLSLSLPHQLNPSNIRHCVSISCDPIDSVSRYHQSSIFHWFSIQHSIDPLIHWSILLYQLNLEN